MNPRHAFYILPNAFTTAALFCGFYAILKAISGDWQMAAWAVLASAVLDSCDGRVARLTGTTSAFGVEYDSLSDMVAFGVAPAILMFQWSLMELGKTGFAAVFIYCAATALRLARFNTQVGSADRRFFIGLPSPAAAAILVSFVASVDQYELQIPAHLSSLLCVWVGVTMVSGIRFYSFKTINLRARRPLFNGLVMIGIFAVLYIFVNDLMLLLLVALLGYMVVSYGWSIMQFIQRRLHRTEG